jgi:branched-chain amino acid transport system substrate-binding protein
MKLRKLGIVGAAGLLAVTAAVPAFAQSPATAGEIMIGVDLPLSGGEQANGVPTLNGVLLAIRQRNAEGGVQGWTLVENVKDDAVNGVHNENQGATNVTTLIGEGAAAMVGPFNSSVARAQIPVTNEAGLPQCSPANTAVDLTGEGSEQWRPANPDVRNYFRVASRDDVQGPGLAQYAYNNLGKRTAYVVDDTEAFGVGVANTFSGEFERLGGTIVKRDGNDFDTNKDFTSLLTAVQGQFDVAFWGGTQVTGGGQFRKDMGSLGMLEIPLVGPDGIADLQPGGAEGAFITLAGVENSDNVYGSVAGIHDIPDPEAFAEAYSAEFNAPPGAYSALAFACTEIIIAAIDAALTGGADPSDIAAFREAVRAAVFAGEEVETVLGPVTIDEFGDSSQKWLSYYETDPSLNDGAGGWNFLEQRDFAGVLEGGSPAPEGGSPAPAESIPAESVAP